ncbi:MAG: hypothetical protein H6937_07315 [Burkholderiales bacterium]|nr:hypothetical protein [Burkholderiales bacterium]MDR4516228.1 hypothetical protein [Nitrosomonas sp.]
MKTINRHPNETEDSSEDSYIQDTDGKAKFRQNMQAGHQNPDDDSSISTGASKDHTHEKSGP